MKVIITMVSVGIWCALALLIAAFSTGCGSTVGWQTTVSVTPITAVHDELHLNQKTIEAKRY